MKFLFDLVERKDGRTVSSPHSPASGVTTSAFPPVSFSGQEASV